jgi:hypothetical protein
MEEQFCPACGCLIGENSYEKDGVLYCCASCARGGPCECGCGVVVEEEEK